jgi:hypothetical protein
VQEQLIPEFLFWNTVLKLTILLIIRSVRNRDDDLYIQSMNGLMPYFFADDSTNYARWLSVHIFDLLNLLESNSHVCEVFKTGMFVIHKIERPSQEWVLTRSMSKATLLLREMVEL